MNQTILRQSRILSLAACGAVAVVVAAPGQAARLFPQEPQPQPAQQGTAQGSVTQSREPAATVRIPRQQAANSAALDGMIREQITPTETRLVPGVHLTLRNLQSGQVTSVMAAVDGAFRVVPLAPGHYELTFEAQGYAKDPIPDLVLNPNEVLTL